MEDSDAGTMTSPLTTKSKAKEKEEAIPIPIEQTTILNSEADQILQANSKDKLLEPDESFEQLNKKGGKSSSPEEDLGKNEGAEIIEMEKQLSDSEEALLDKGERVSATKEELEEVGEAHLNEQLNVHLVKLSKNNEKIDSFEQTSNLKVKKKAIMGEGSTENGKELDTAGEFMQENFAETVSEIDVPGSNVQFNEDLSQVDEEDDNVSSYEVVFLKGDGGKGEAISDLADAVMLENVDEKLQDVNEAHLNGGLPQVDEKNDRKIKSHETLAIKDTKVLLLDNVVGEGESFRKDGEITHVRVEEKHLDVSLSCITKKPIVKHEKPSTMHFELGTEVEKPLSLKEGETNSTCKPSLPNLHVNEVKEQYPEKRNASLLVELVTKDDKSNPIDGNFVSNDDNSLHIDEGLAAKNESNLSINNGVDKKENDKNDEDKGGPLVPENILDKAMDDVKKQDETEEMDIGEDGPASAAGKRSTKKLKIDRPKQFQNKKIRTHKPKEDESLCFICYDGGDLVVCDHRSCPKVYHPLCINRDEAYFKAKGRWLCGWHICDSCGKNAHYMCYTCTHSLCKGCLRKAEFEFICVRGNRGLCEDCIKTVMMIETKKGAEQTMEKGVIDGMSLFKDYWEEVNEKLSLTVEELTRASDAMKEPNLASTKKKETSNKVRADKIEVEPSENEPESTKEGQIGSSSRRLKRNKETTSAGIKKLKKQLKRSKNKHAAVEWASKELLDFVAHMKGGDKSELSQFDVQDLLLAYIKQNNLRDPSKKSQIICDARLLELFGKEHVGHLEMLKILESHFLIKEASALATDENQGGVVDPEPSQIDTEETSDTNTKTTSGGKKKSRKNTGEQGLATSVEEYAAIDVHNVSKMYLRRSLIENLLDDTDTFNDNVVGAFVRIRLSGCSSNNDIYKEMYRLVQVVGTGKAANIYNTGMKTTDITLEVLNLSKREFRTIDLISNQEFTEEECKRLRQSIRCGLIKRLTVAQAQEKANVLHAVKVKDLLESEKLRFNNLRDRASEKGRIREHRSIVEKLQLLSSPEEHFKRLNKLPEIHVDSNMDLDYTSADDEDQNARSQDKNKSSNVSFRDSRKYTFIPNNEVSDARQLNSPVTPKSYAHTANSNMSFVNNTLSRREPVQSSTHSPGASSQIPSAKAVVPNIDETEKIWHYQDPAGKIQGPFSLTVLRKWNASKFFPANLQIWRTSEKQEDSILLTDALDGKISNISKHANANQSTNTGALNDFRANNFSDTSSSTRQFQQHGNNNATRTPHSRENNCRWNGGQKYQNNWNSNGPNRRFQSNNNRGFGRHNSYHNSYQNPRNQQFPERKMNMHPSNVAKNQSLPPQQGNNIDWAMLQGAINNILPSSNVNPVQPSQLITSANVNAASNIDPRFIQPANSQAIATTNQAVSLNASNTPGSFTVPDASVQQQQMNMVYPTTGPNAMNMNWGMMAQAPMNMNMNWGAVPNMNMGWGPSGQPNMNPNLSLGWVMPPQGIPMQVNPASNPGWVAPAVGIANPNASWVAPQALGNSANQTANCQANPNGATNQVIQ